MKCVILCGGKGTRLMEMTDVLPKPMLPVGDRPLLHHIFDIYKKWGLRDFYLPVGYKKEQIIAYLLGSIGTGEYSCQGGVLKFTFPDMTITVVDTGSETLTGGRLKRLEPFLRDAPFHFTYGDGLSDVNLCQVDFLHFKFQSIATLTLVHPEGRFGRVKLEKDGLISDFGEKLETTDWINGGFAVLRPEIFQYIDGDDVNLEKEVYPLLALEGQLRGYLHDGFWKCCDTKRDLLELDELYREEGARWLK